MTSDYAKSKDDHRLTWRTIGAGSLVHFVHNAEFLAEYPNMPAWLSRTDVYIAWLGITAIGVAGYVLAGHGYRLAGLLLVAVYATLGLIAAWQAARTSRR